MSENTNDLYMQWNTTLGATHTSIFLAVGLAKGVISLVHFRYKTFQEDMKRDGRTVDDSEVIATPEEYADKAKMSNEDYIRKQMEDPQVAKAMDVKEREEMDPELFEALNKAGDSESLACGQYFKNENYMPISIDDQTLVHNPKDRMVFDIQMKNPGVFACRIPGTYGENEQVLLLPTEQVFKVEDAKRPRYIAFLRTDTKPAVISAGRDNVIGSPYEDAKALYQHFDREGKKPSYNPEHLETISAEEMKGGWEGIEPAAAKKKPPAGMSQATYDKIHSFPEHDYDFAAIEKRMLAKSRGGGKAAEFVMRRGPSRRLGKSPDDPEAAAAAVKGDAAEVTEGAEEVAKTIANSIPTKTLSL